MSDGPLLPMSMPVEGTVLPPLDDPPAFQRVKAVLDARNRGPVGWLDTAAIAKLVIGALRYVDGEDEPEAIAAAAAIPPSDPVTVIECVDAYFATLLRARPDQSSSAGMPTTPPTERPGHAPPVRAAPSSHRRPI